MSPTQTLGAYGAALALVLGAGFGLGRAVGPVGAPAGPAPHSTTGPDHTGTDMDMDMETHR